MKCKSQKAMSSNFSMVARQRVQCQTTLLARHMVALSGDLETGVG